MAAVTEHEDPSTDPAKMVLHNARLKAAAVSRLHPEAIVLGSDTTVALGDRALNKPADLAESRAMLRALSGRDHTVHTGVCLLCPALGIDESHDVTAWVRFRDLSEDDITRYQSLVNTLDKAGAYGIQGRAAMFIEDLPILRARLALSASSTPAALVAVIHEVANSLGVIGARRGAARVRMTERCLREGSDMDMLAIERVAVEDLSSAESALQAWLAASPGL